MYKREGTRRFGDRRVIGRFGDKVSSKRLLTGWEENCRQNVLHRMGENVYLKITTYIIR